MLRFCLADSSWSLECLLKRVARKFLVRKSWEHKKQLTKIFKDSTSVCDRNEHPHNGCSSSSPLTSYKRPAGKGYKMMIYIYIFINIYIHVATLAQEGGGIITHHQALSRDFSPFNPLLRRLRSSTNASSCSASELHCVAFDGHAFRHYLQASPSRRWCIPEIQGLSVLTSIFQFVFQLRPHLLN